MPHISAPSLVTIKAQQAFQKRYGLRSANMAFFPTSLRGVLVFSLGSRRGYLRLALRRLLFIFTHRSLTHPVTHSRTHALTHSLTHPLTHSDTHSLTQSLTHSSSLTHLHSLIFTHSLTHPPTHSLLTRSLTRSLTH